MCTRRSSVFSRAPGTRLYSEARFTLKGGVRYQFIRNSKQLSTHIVFVTVSQQNNSAMGPIIIIVHCPIIKATSKLYLTFPLKIPWSQLDCKVFMLTALKGRCQIFYGQLGWLGGAHFSHWLSISLKKHRRPSGISSGFCSIVASSWCRNPRARPTLFHCGTTALNISVRMCRFFLKQYCVTWCIKIWATVFSWASIPLRTHSSSKIGTNLLYHLTLYLAGIWVYHWYSCIYVKKNHKLSIIFSTDTKRHYHVNYMCIKLSHRGSHKLTELSKLVVCTSLVVYTYSL